jgi:hypothetical protein
MNRSALPILLLSLAASLCAGCGHHKTDAKSELEKTATLLAQPGEAQAPPAEPAPEPSAPAPVASPSVPEAPALPPTPSQQMRLAITSFKTGELEDAVTRLQKLRATPTLTPEQRMAVQDSVAAVMLEIYQLAEKGDQRAIAAVKQYEEIQTRAH